MNDQAVVRAFVLQWPRRAGIRRDEYYSVETEADPSLPDYPASMLPFEAHPAFERTPEETRSQILTWAWLVYNQRVVEIEHLVTNTAIRMLLDGELPGADEFHVRQSLQQTLIDEQFHVMMHEAAVRNTLHQRRIAKPLRCRHSIVYRALLAHQAEVPESWQKNLLTLAWTVVSEMTINAYLGLLAEADGIRPSHRRLNWLHNRDEAAHNRIFLHLTRIITRRLDASQRHFFLESLPTALGAFTQHDFTAWAAILEEVGVTARAELLGDAEAEARAGRSHLISDVSRVRRMIAELNDDLGVRA